MQHFVKHKLSFRVRVVWECKSIEGGREGGRQALTQRTYMAIRVKRSTSSSLSFFLGGMAWLGKRTQASAGCCC